jgi:hypothetical protein
MGVSNGDEDGGGVDGDGSEGNSPSRQGAGTEISVPRTRVDDDGGYGTFRGWRLWSLGFSRGCEYIGRSARLVDARGAHTIARNGQGRARAMAWCGHLPALLRLPFGLYLRVRKIGTLAFVSSNFENISFSNNLE